MRHFLLPAAVAVGLAAAPATATDFSNNLHASYDNSWLSNIFTHVNACGCGPLDSAAFVDSFALSTAGTVTTVRAAVTAVQQNATSNFTSFTNVPGYQVNIYSSLAAAAGSLTGDVYSKSFTPGGVGFAATVPVPADGYTVAATLATFTVDARLAAGRYFVSVIGVDDPDSNESIGIAASGTGTAALVNPGGDFGLPGNSLATGEAAAYAVSGTVPEPASWAMLIAGFALTGAMMRRRAAAYVTA